MKQNKKLEKVLWEIADWWWCMSFEEEGKLKDLFAWTLVKGDQVST